eukprot:TRINITY_DN8159_c0_g1_i2.p1 TRINITY_DN8159_c0_g1~~TRINITY_DN8159_c0_g1_i2.p1  ORF type:complete len:390 (+),score=75.76 TRINITY_DN8159_c0_g1_i2:1447-2616(+)
MSYEFLVKNGWLKRGQLTKRGQAKSALGRNNYKQRTFILLHDRLVYFQGAETVALKLKGQIPLKAIRAVERADGRPWGQSNMLQIVHDEAILYACADTQPDRQDWIDAIREACEQPEQSTSKHSTYHPGVMFKGKMSCCGEKRNTGGCKPAYEFYVARDEKPIISKQSSASSVRYVADEDFEEDSDFDPDEMSDAQMAELPVNPADKTATMQTIVDEPTNSFDPDFADLDTDMFRPQDAKQPSQHYGAGPLQQGLSQLSVGASSDAPDYSNGAYGEAMSASEFLSQTASHGPVEAVYSTADSAGGAVEATYSRPNSEAYDRLAPLPDNSPEGYESWVPQVKPAGAYTPASIASNFSQASIYSTLDESRRAQPGQRHKHHAEPTYDRLKR